MDNEALETLFDINGLKLEKCLEPTMCCTQKAIRAHSIQNAKVLDLIQHNGHLVWLKGEFREGKPNITFKSIGRNKASTFTGFCAKHDAEIFRLLDTQAFDVENKQHLFLLAYHSVSRELHAVMEGAIKIQGAYQARVEKGLDPSGSPSPAGMLAVSHFANAYDTWLYRADSFDQALGGESYADLCHTIIKYDTQSPTIVVSALFSLDEFSRNAGVARCVVNVFPTSAETTIVVFSYTKSDKKIVLQALSKVLEAEGDLQKYELSKLIVERVENFFISPTFFDLWSLSKQAAIKEAFVQTLGHLY